jgi:hypothetical protein
MTGSNTISAPASRRYRASVSLSRRSFGSVAPEVERANAQVSTRRAPMKIANRPETRKWRCKGLKRLNSRLEMVVARKLRTPRSGTWGARAEHFSSARRRSGPRYRARAPWDSPKFHFGGLAPEVESENVRRSGLGAPHENRQSSNRPEARKWRCKGLKRLNSRPEMVVARKSRTPKIWYVGASVAFFVGTPRSARATALKLLLLGNSETRKLGKGAAKS